MNQRRRINIRANVATLENVTYVIKRVVPTVINNRKIQHLRRRRVNLTVLFDEKFGLRGPLSSNSIKNDNE